MRAMARSKPPRKPPKARSVPRARNASTQPVWQTRPTRGKPANAGKPARGAKRARGAEADRPAQPALRKAADTAAARSRTGRGGTMGVPSAPPPSLARDAAGAHRAGSRPASPNRGRGLWLFGRHAVETALRNPHRGCHRLLATPEALARLPRELLRGGLTVEEVEREVLDRRLGDDTLHQGLALSVAPLPTLDLKRACLPEPGRNLVLVLDQVQDPHNLGAILRSAAAFEARAVVLPNRNSAPLGGVAAKAASGALDLVPVVEVTNLARALLTLKELDYWRVALDGAAAATIETVPAVDNLALVLGAEGSGVRRLVRESCDLSVRLPIAPAMASLNVSVACGIALYALAGHRPPG
jgi:23S rRNA (guanosine2251-2'-O)-methyltransferase